ncbi:MAG TPA: DUF5719 family protein [Acidimicrobiia bacterium]|nr:DUF5719 family protein [Acidimicrobiia bacterium]
MKYVAAVVMIVLAVAATVPSAPEAVQHDPPPATELPPISTCPLIVGSGRSTNIGILSSVNGQGRVSSFSSGASGSVEFRTGATGAVTIDAAEAGAVAFSGGLVEMPTATTAAGVVTIGESDRAAESCADIPTGQAFLSGGSTASGAGFDVQLLNPYAGEARVELTVTTDAGIESDDRFDAIRVPPLSTATVRMGEIIPGREEISVAVEVISGSALAVGRQTTEGRTALWRAVEPAQDWWLPIPQGGGTKQLLLATPTNTEVEYQIDHYGPEGFQEGLATGTLAARGSQRVGLADITEQTAGVRVISTGPLVPTLWMNTSASLALTTASPVDASAWLLPGAHSPPGGGGTAVILNTGIEDVTVDVITLRETALTRRFDLSADAVLEVDLVDADGYRVEASGPIVVLWTSQLGGDGTAAIGIPIQDG